MTDATRLLNAVAGGEPNAASQLLPLVYNELRRLAAHKIAGEQAGQSLDATFLVHEAYLRLVSGHPGQPSNQPLQQAPAAISAPAEAHRDGRRLLNCIGSTTKDGDDRP